jgi:hypothetical protein
MLPDASEFGHMRHQSRYNTPSLAATVSVQSHLRVCLPWDLDFIHWTLFVLVQFLPLLCRSVIGTIRIQLITKEFHLLDSFI